MLSLLLHIFSSVCVASVVTMETVVGVAGRKVRLPCRLEAASQGGVQVCWGRGQPSLFTCHNTVIDAAGAQVSYRKSHRYSVSPSSWLSISDSEASDSGFYHCRVQLPGLFNDQTSTVHLIVLAPRSASSDSSAETSEPSDHLNAPQTTTGYSTGSDVTGNDTTGPMAAPVQSSVQQQVNSLQSFVGNTLRVSFITFIPALLLSAAYRVWRNNKRSETDGRPNQSEEEDSSV